MSLSRLVIEITNKCNLNCAHCLRESPAAPGDFPLDLLERVLGQAAGAYNMTHCALTGGEPLLHARFEEALDLIAGKGFNFSIVTNGHLVPKRLPVLARHARAGAIKHIAISLDGPDSKVHDRVRGEGAYKKAMAATAMLRSAGIPFGLKYTIGAHNCDSVEAAALGMAHLDPAFVDFAVMMPTPDNVRAGLAPSPAQAKAAQDAVLRLSREMKTPISTSAGIMCDHAFFSCASLAQLELYVDVLGRLCFCCVLPGLRGKAGDGREIVADLAETDLWDAHKLLVDTIGAFQKHRAGMVGAGRIGDIERFQCMACARFFGRLGWLDEFAESPWSEKR